jgi:hypothetical protein
MKKLGKELDNALYFGHFRDKHRPRRLRHRMVAGGRRIVMLHSFVKKTDKTPLAERRIAKARLKEIKQETHGYQSAGRGTARKRADNWQAIPVDCCASEVCSCLGQEAGSAIQLIRRKLANVMFRSGLEVKVTLHYTENT